MRPSTYYFDLVDGVDARAEAKKLEAAFLAHGVESDAIEDLLDDAIGVQRSFNWPIEGFMGLGLIVGVAALGVISARAVVERRQQIGILRAIGFRRGAIQLGFLLESSFIATTAIVVGTLFGLICAVNVIDDVTANNRSLEALTVSIPLAEPGARVRRRLRGRPAHHRCAGDPCVADLPRRGPQVRVAPARSSCT